MRFDLMRQNVRFLLLRHSEAQKRPVLIPELVALVLCHASLS